jgi:predicted outer membrane repeat protein
VYGTATITRFDTHGQHAAQLDDGGAWYGSGTLVDSTLAFNSAGTSGGGWYSTGASTIVQSTISNNNAGSEGGGIFSDTNITIRQSTITENHAVGKGGGIRQSNNGTAVITNTIITENRTDEPLSQDVFGENFSPASTYNRIGIVDGRKRSVWPKERWPVGWTIRWTSGFRPWVITAARC